MLGDDRYLVKRGHNWQYVRRVPTRFQDFDRRVFSKKSLKTRSIVLARERRNAMERADDDYWMALVSVDINPEKEVRKRHRDAIKRRHELSCLQAVSISISENALNVMLLELTLGDALSRHRFETLGADHQHSANNLHALHSVRSCHPPPAKLTEAFELYCDQIAMKEIIYKSHEQRAQWRKSKYRSICNFVRIVGDKDISEITREDAQKFYGWWVERMRPKLGGRPLGANSANRDIGNIRKLYREYFTYFGDDDRPNPFRNLYFKRMPSVETPPFTDEWVRNEILRPGALDHLNQDAFFITCVLIETGCRTSEIANLISSDIVLSTDVPYIRIRPRRGREIKSPSAVRDIPLVGVALEAMKRRPKGFARYRNDSEKLSPYLLKVFRNNDLMPTPHHVIYSFRHSFERRMLEAGLDYGLRCRLMGHATQRPDYGGGGSMAFRRDQLLKIVYPFSDELFW